MSDWWSVGIIIYQLMMLRTPFELPEFKNDKNLDKDAFRNERSEENNNRIRTMEINFNNPPSNQYSSNLKDVVMKLLNRDTEKRLG